MLVAAVVVALSLCVWWPETAADIPPLARLLLSRVAVALVQLMPRPRERDNEPATAVLALADEPFEVAAQPYRLVKYLPSAVAVALFFVRLVNIVLAVLVLAKDTVVALVAAADDENRPATRWRLVLEVQDHHDTNTTNSATSAQAVHEPEAEEATVVVTPLGPDITPCGSDDTAVAKPPKVHPVALAVDDAAVAVEPLEAQHPLALVLSHSVASGTVKPHPLALLLNRAAPTVAPAHPLALLLKNRLVLTPPAPAPRSISLPLPLLCNGDLSDTVGGSLLAPPGTHVAGDDSCEDAPKLVKASDHRRYAKYFKLLKMRMPRAQLALKMAAEGLDATLLDTPDAMILDRDAASDASQSTTRTLPLVPPPPKLKAKPKLRNLYWDIVKDEVARGTIWEKFAQTDKDDNDNDDNDVVGTPYPESPVPRGVATLVRRHSSYGDDGRRDVVLEQYVTKLAELFVNQPAKAKESERATKPATNPKRVRTRVEIFDAKRAYNIGIMLARFRLPYYKIRDAVLLVDKTILSPENVAALLQFAPEDEEIEAVKSYSGDPKLLGDAEQYFREMLCVPRLPSRLQAIHATWQFDTYVEEQQKLMEAVSHACEELEACEPLKQIFRVVLELGNALNDGTVRGGAKGFRLNILLKLNQVKASDNSITLLNYVAQLLRAKDPQILEFDKQLPSLESASRVTVQVLRAGESAVRKAATQIVDELAAHAKLPPAEFPSPPHLDGEEPVIITDRFQDVVKPFADRAQKISDDVVEQLEKTMQSFEDTASFYGEDPASPECGPDSFFSIFYSFAKLLQAADRDNERKRVNEERRVHREEETKKRLEMLKKKKKAMHASPFASLKMGDVDAIVERVHAKRVAKKRAELLGLASGERSGDSVADTGACDSSSDFSKHTASAHSESILIIRTPSKAAIARANRIFQSPSKPSGVRPRSLFRSPVKPSVTPSKVFQTPTKPNITPSKIFQSPNTPSVPRSRKIFQSPNTPSTTRSNTVFKSPGTPSITRSRKVFQSPGTPSVTRSSKVFESPGIPSITRSSKVFESPGKRIDGDHRFNKTDSVDTNASANMLNTRVRVPLPPSPPQGHADKGAMEKVEMWDGDSTVAQ